MEFTAGEDIKPGQVVYLDDQTGKLMLIRPDIRPDDNPIFIALRDIASDELITPDGEKPDVASSASFPFRPTGPVYIQPKPLTDEDIAEVEAYAEYLDNIDQGGPYEEIRRMVAELRRLRANGDGAVTKGT